MSRPAAAGRADGSEILALAVALATGIRAGVDVGQLSNALGDAVRELAGGSPVRVEFLLSELVGQVGVMLAEACDQWSKAVGGDPAGQWLAIIGRAAAEQTGPT